jgi:hypothetical protein
MGIPKFLNYLKTNYNSPQWYHTKSNDRKWDYMILDYQSLIYSNYSVFCNDINYFIRIIYKIELNNNSELLEIANSIIKKYPKYFQKIIEYNVVNMNNIKEFINPSISYNNMNNIIDTIVILMLDNTKDLANMHSIPYNNMYIFFDGIPSLAKIKEQVGRRIYPEIMKEITTKMLNSMSDCIEKKLRLDILLPEYAPTIAPGSILVTKIRDKLIQEGFNVNSIRLGEAEHQIMEYLIENSNIFKNSNILLASPDADLILLSLINMTRGFNIDIIRQNANINNTIFNISYDYIIIDRLRKELKLDDNQKVIDICYSLLLLGDDFVPIISGMTIKALPIIIKTYDKLKLSLIDIIKNKLIYDNFIIFIKELSKQNFFVESRKIFNFRDKIIEFNNYAKIYFIKEFSRENIGIIEKIYLLNSGYIDNKTNYISLLNYNKKEYITTNDMIINYIEGCIFIFDLYINNTIKDYRWFYRYETTPTLKQLANYMQNHTNLHNNILIKNNYMDLSTYIKYITMYKNIIILECIHRIKNSIQDHMKNSRIIINENNIDKLKKKYLTYSNVKYIFNCNNKIYFNKCIEISNPPLNF